MLDQSHSNTRQEAFFRTIAQMLDHGAVAVMVSLGHRLDLFNLMAGRAPSSSGQIASAGGLSERYVREWLAVMVTGGIVEFDAATGTYCLPDDHASCLTDGGAMGNMAVYAQSVALSGGMQSRLEGAFRTGEGIRYGEYPCFHQIMAEDSSQTVVAELEGILAALVPDVVARLRDGIGVLDAGCGAGRATIKMARLFPASLFVGYDLCADAVEMARAGARAAGVMNVIFERRDLAVMRETDRFDLITSFDAVHDTPDPAGLLAAYARALRPGGVHLMQDIGGSAKLENNLDFPFAPLLYTMSCVHCTPVSLAQGGQGLGTMWGWETAQDMLERAGFASVTRQVFPHDPMNVWFTSRKEGPA